MDSRLQLQIGIDEDIQRLPSGFRSRSVRLRAENGDGQPFNRDLWQIDASVTIQGGKAGACTQTSGDFRFSRI